MTRRELVVTAIAITVTVLCLSVYDCGARRGDRALKQAAETALTDARTDRDALRAQLGQERKLRELTTMENDGLKRRADSLALRARLRQQRADSLAEIVRQHAAEIDDTTTMVPVDWFAGAQQAMETARQQYREAEAARLLLRDSVVRNDSILQSRLVTAIDSVKATLARDDTRAPVIHAGVTAGSDRCAWGPFGLMPCVTRKTAFLGGVVAGAVAIRYGDEFADFTKEMIRKLK